MLLEVVKSIDVQNFTKLSAAVHAVNAFTWKIGDDAENNIAVAFEGSNNKKPSFR